MYYVATRENSFIDACIKTKEKLQYLLLIIPFFVCKNHIMSTMDVYKRSYYSCLKMVNIVE